MNLDTVTFFLIVVGGVVFVWSFRRASGRKSEIKEIEYLAFASLWGTLLVAGYVELLKLLNLQTQLERLLANPLASSLVFSCLGLLLGTTVGILDRRFGIGKFIVKCCKKVEGQIFNKDEA